MNIKEWHYYNDKNDFGSYTLNEVIDRFNDGKLNEATFIRHQKWAYRKPLRQCAQIRAHLKWEYFDEDTLHSNLYGYELATKVLNKEISDKTLVRLEGGLLIPFKDSYLTPLEEKPYQGYTSIIYNFWSYAEVIVTFIIMFGISVGFTLMLKPKPSEINFMLIALFIDNLLILLHSYFIHKKGYSLFSRLFGVYLLNTDGSKVSVINAFFRHCCLKSDVEEYDKSAGIMLTRQRPKDE